jgi:hypothetical protein
MPGGTGDGDVDLVACRGYLEAAISTNEGRRGGQLCARSLGGREAHRRRAGGPCSGRLIARAIGRFLEGSGASASTGPYSDIGSLFALRAAVSQGR